MTQLMKMMNMLSQGRTHCIWLEKTTYNNAKIKEHTNMNEISLEDPTGLNQKRSTIFKEFQIID